MYYTDFLCSPPIKIHKRLKQTSYAHKRLVNQNRIFMLNISLFLTLGKCLICLVFLRIVPSLRFSSLVVFLSMFSSVALVVYLSRNDFPFVGRKLFLFSMKHWHICGSNIFKYTNKENRRRIFSPD